MLRKTWLAVDVAAGTPHLSAALHRKVPASVMWIVDSRTFFFWFWLGLAILALHGPVVGRTDYNAFRYLLAPWFCPLVAVCYYAKHPYNPYKNPLVSANEKALVSRRDPDAMRLVETFRSAEARRVTIRASLKVSTILFAAMAALALLHRQSLVWTIWSEWQVIGLSGGTIAASLMVAGELLNWGMKTWARSLESVR